VDPGKGADSCSSAGGGSRCWVSSKTGCMNADNIKNSASLTYADCDTD
jgi:hypothetical protein